jgi:hypothetical protein
MILGPRAQSTPEPGVHGIEPIAAPTFALADPIRVIVNPPQNGGNLVVATHIPSTFDPINSSKPEKVADTAATRRNL